MHRLADFKKTLTGSAGTIRNVYARVRTAFLFFNTIHTSPNFLEITTQEFEQFFQFIDKKKITKKTKTRFRFALLQYADFACRNIYAHNKRPPLDYSYIFSDRLFKFSKYKQISNNAYLEFEDALRLLRWAKYSKPPQIYFMICLQLTTGCRVGGLLGLIKNDVNLKNRTLKMHEKGGDSLYFIGSNLIKPLEFYMQYLPEDQQELFKISEQKYNLNLKDFSENMHSHVFRDCLNGIWEDAGVEESIRDIMVNRTPTSINGKNYMKKYKNWQKRLQKWDSIYPFNDVFF